MLLFVDDKELPVCPVQASADSCVNKNAVRLINLILAQRYRHHVLLALSRRTCPRLVIR